MINSIGINNIAPTLEQCRRRPITSFPKKEVIANDIDLFVPDTDAVQDKSNPDKSRELIANSAGFIAGITAPSYVLYDNFHKVSKKEARDMAELMQMLLPSADTLDHTKATVERILKDTGLQDKGLKVNFIDKTNESANHLREVISSEISHNSLMGTRLKENYFNIFNEGGNAAFFPKSNEIIMSEKGLFDTVYHEIGHAMNKNGSMFTRLLQKSRLITPFMVSVVAPVALLTALLHKTDNIKPKEEKSIFERSLDFVSNHATALTAISYAPVLAEEGLASVRGINLARKYLEPEKVTKLACNYAKAWATYAGVAAVVSGGVAVGIKLANYLKREEKQSKGVKG